MNSGNRMSDGWWRMAWMVVLAVAATFAPATRAELIHSGTVSWEQWQVGGGNVTYGTMHVGTTDSSGTVEITYPDDFEVRSGQDLLLQWGSITVSGSGAELETQSGADVTVGYQLDLDTNPLMEIKNQALWDAPNQNFVVGKGGDAVLRVYDDATLDRGYTASGSEIWLNLGQRMTVGEDTLVGEGTLEISGGGRVIGNVAVGANGGEGVLVVGDGGALGRADGDFGSLRVGSGTDSVGTATFESGSESSNPIWRIGHDGGTGTLTVQGAVNTFNDGTDALSVLLGDGDGHGTLNIESGANVVVDSMYLTDGITTAGTSQLNLDNGTLRVSDTFRTSGVLAGANSTEINLTNGSQLTVNAESWLGNNNASAVVNITDSQWTTGGRMHLGPDGNFTLNLNAGATWSNIADAGDGDAPAAVWIGYGSPASSPADNAITLTGTAEAPAVWDAQVPVAISNDYTENTTITLNGNSQWTVHDTLTIGGDTQTDAQIFLNEGSQAHWKQGIDNNPTFLDINLNGGTLVYGEAEEILFPTRWIESFTAGTLEIRGGGTITDTLPELTDGMAFVADRVSAGLVPLDGGTVTVSDLEVDEAGDASVWSYQPSGSGGWTYDTLTLEAGGHMRTNGAFNTSMADFTWTGGQLTVDGVLTMPAEDYLGTDTHRIDDGRSLTLDGVGADADFRDAPMRVSSFGGGGLELKNNASLTSGVDGGATPDTVEGTAVVAVRSGATWASYGDVAIGNETGGMAAEVLLDGGSWTSLGAVAVGDDVMAAGKVSIDDGGRWNAEAGYDKGSMGTVNLTGGTLQYGTADNPFDFDPSDKLNEFSSGRLITYGSYIGDLELRDGASISGDRFTGSVINGGLFLPGHSPAATVIEGDFEQTATGVLEMEIFGTTPGAEYDTLEIQGDVIALAGELAIYFQEYRPELTQTFGLFDWNWEVADGTFDALTFDVQGYSGDLDYSSGILTITSVPEPTSFLLLLAGLCVLAHRKHPVRNKVQNS